ncbi:hypothetical protein EJ07DRAFT_158758 [Lizonia empirigonia]|nr:hypothetical protein EJ07DRAFT_158758 [Lizonia empirigonia]
MMLFFLLLAFISLAVAQQTCVAANPSLSLPSCMVLIATQDDCFRTNGCNSDACPCPDNLKGWCEMSKEGPASWFSRWGFCVSIDCPDDGDITGTKGGPLTNESVPAPLNDYLPKTTLRSSTLSSSTASPAIQTVATLTGIKTTDASSLESALLSTDMTASTASSSSQSSSAASSVPAPSNDPKSGMSVAAIAGVAVGGAVLLAIFIGIAIFFIRRRKRRQSSESTSPPAYEPAGSKQVYDKPELDGHALEYRYAEVDGSMPVGYAELDAGGPCSTNFARALFVPLLNTSQTFQFMAMMIAAFFLLGLSAAARNCYEASPRSKWLDDITCVDECIMGDTGHLDGICADSLKAICQLDGAVASYFRVFTSCLSRYCPSDADRMNFVTAFRVECGFYNSSVESQAQLFGDWKRYFMEGPMISVDTQIVIPQVNLPPFTWPPSVATAITKDPVSTVLEDEKSSTRRAGTPPSSGSLDSFPISTSHSDEPALSPAAMTGTAVGGAVLLTLVVGFAFFVIRRRKRGQSEAQPRSISPPNYEPEHGKVVVEKAELEGQALEHRLPKVGVGAPVGYAELDGSPVCPIRESVFLSANERNTRMATNF